MRTKLVLHISTFTLLVALIVGCNKTNDNPSIPKASLGVSVVLEDLSTKGMVEKAGFNNGSSIDVVLKNENSSENDYLENGKPVKRVFTYNSSTSAWAVETGKEYELGAQRGLITAFYPTGLTSAELTDNIKTLTPQIQQSTSIDLSSAQSVQLNDATSVKLAATEKDYMIGKGTAVSANAATSTITMRHSMAMVAIQLNKDGSYTQPGKLTKIVLASTDPTLNPILFNGSIEVATETFNEGSTPVSYTRTLTGGDYTHGENIAFLSYPAILYEDGLAKLTLTIDGTDHSVLLRGALDGSLSLETGKCILYKVNISGTKLSINSVSIIPWTSSTVVNQNIKPNDNPELAATLELSQYAPTSNILATGGTYTIDVTSNTKWKAAATNCTIDNVSGDGNGQVTITVEPDPDNLEREVRVDFNTLLIGGENTKKSWVGTQERGALKITIKTEEFNIFGGEGSFILSIASNSAWSATGVNCTIESANAEGVAGVSTIPFSVSEFKSGARDILIKIESKEDASCNATWKSIQSDTELIKLGNTYWTTSNVTGVQGQTSGYGLATNKHDYGSLFKWGSKHVYDRISGSFPDLHWIKETTKAADTPYNTSTENKGYDYADLDPSAISGTSGDPCSVVGTNFRTPTSEQWGELIASGNSVFVQVTTTPGILYGQIDEITTNQVLLGVPEGCIFLPASGYRYALTGILTENVGYYISSSVNDGKSNQAFTFSDTGVVTHPTATLRGNGQSLRCVYKPQL